MSQSRYDASGGTKQSLTSLQADVGEQLNLKAKQLEYLASNGGIDYGEITLPSDFPLVLPFKFYRDFDSRIKHNFNFASIEASPTKTIYVVSPTGNDTTGDGTVSLPYLTINKALTIAESAVETKILINISGSFYETDICRTSYSFTNKTIILKSATDGTRILATSAFKNSGIVWVADGGAYKGTRSNIQKTYNVVDLNNKNFHGVAKPLTLVASIALCKTTPNSYYALYSDATAQIYVNRLDGSAPDSNLLVLGEYPAISFTLNSSTLFIKDFEFYSCLGTGVVTVNGDINSTLVHKNSIFSAIAQLSPTSITNGLTVVNVGRTYGFNSVCGYTGRDGFNYHFAGISVGSRRQCLVFEYECLGHDCGVNDVNDNNNTTTVHEGVVVLRIGCIGYRSKGPIQADVGGCYSLLYDCKMRDSLYQYGTNYEGYDAGGVLILINCESSGARYADIGTTTPFDVRLKRFKGNKLLTQIYTVIN